MRSGPARLLTASFSMRMLAHTRRAVLVLLPLGGVMGLLVALVLGALEAFVPWVERQSTHFRLHLATPAVGLMATTLLLHGTGVGPVSLFKDLNLAKLNPYKAFPFWPSVVKVLACGLTIGFGGSAGVEGPGKWFGAAAGVQLHRLLSRLSHLAPPMRRFTLPARVLVRAGAAAALAAVFRAPLSGALMAVEHRGHLDPLALVPCLIAAASGTMAFASAHGLNPLLPMAPPPPLAARELAWALVLGLLCGLGARLYRAAAVAVQRTTEQVPLVWRGALAGLGLVLLALPAHAFWPQARVTQGGGLDLIGLLMIHPLPAGTALAFFGLKLLATACTLGGGGVGGLWLPSLAMGACLGAALAAVLQIPDPAFFMLVGAAAFAGATHQTLLVPVVFLAETTAQASLVVPALVGTTLAFLTTREEAPPGMPARTE